MNASTDLERRLADYYATEAPLRAPDLVLNAALATIDTTPQRQVPIRLPWRFHNVNRFAAVAVAAVAVITVGALALAVLLGGRPAIVGTDSGPSPVLSPSDVPPTVAGAPSPSSSRPELTESFTSTIHGASISYPAGWTAVAATLPWRMDVPTMSSGEADIIYEREDDSPFIGLASRPLAGQSGEDWVQDFAGNYNSDCAAPTEQVTIDGRPGVIVGACPGEDVVGGSPTVAVVSVAQRGYVVYLYRIDDLEWFREIVATVRLQPANAVDPVDGSGFRHPFQVWLPPDVGWEAVPIENEAYAEFRIPGSGPGGDVSAVGVILRAIDGGRIDACDASSPRLPLDAGPQAVIEYLASVPRLDVVDQTPTTVDGMPAVQGFVEIAEPTADCPELRPFAAQEALDEAEVINEPARFRVTTFDVAGEHVVIWTYLIAEDTSWYDVADELIGSFDFDGLP